MVDKIYAMQLFAQVAERKSFTAAAQHLAITKASLSRHIQALEHLVGTPLLTRTTRSVELTPQGVLYYERCRELLVNIDELNGLFHTQNHGVSGRLRVDIPADLAREIVIPQLTQFLQTNPGIELELSHFERKIDLLEEAFDCAIQLDPPSDSSLRIRSLGALPQINCASGNYLSRFGKPETLDDLSAHAMVHYSVGLNRPRQGFEIWHNGASQWLKTGGGLSVNSTITAQSACLAGLGIIQAPRILLTKALNSGQLTEILPQYAAKPVNISLVHPTRRYLSRRASLFMAWLSDTLQEHIL